MINPYQTSAAPRFRLGNIFVFYNREVTIINRFLRTRNASNLENGAHLRFSNI